jgi:hypothetical protein
VEEHPSGTKARNHLPANVARLNSLLKKPVRCGKSSETKVAGAEAHIHSADFIGPTEVVPLLQSPFDWLFQ